MAQVGRLFYSMEEAGGAPLGPNDADLSRIVVIAPANDAEYERIHTALQSLYEERREARENDDGPRSASATKAIIAYLKRLRKESDDGETEQANRYDQAA